MLMLRYLSLPCYFCCGASLFANSDKSDGQALRDSKLEAPKLGLSYAGGGQLSLVTLSAFMSAFRAVLGDGSGLPGRPASMKDIMTNVDITTSSSGGTWFAAILYYSDLFNNVLSAVAANPTYASEIWAESFNELQTKAWGGNSFAKFVSLIVKNTIGGKKDFSNVLVEASLGWALPDLHSIRLSATAQSWAEGITWAIAVSQMTPSTKATAVDLGGKLKYFANKSAPGVIVGGFSDKIKAALPSNIPAAISARLSASGSARTVPTTYASKPVCSLLTYSYCTLTGDTCKYNTSQSETCTSLDSNTDEYLLEYAVAASSAFVGTLDRQSLTSWAGNTFVESSVLRALTDYAAQLPVIREAAEADAPIKAGLAIDISDSPSQDAFNPLPEQSDDALKYAVASARRSLIDAAFTDNSAVALQLAQGTSKVFYMNFGVNGSTWGDLDKLCGNYDLDPGTKTMYHVLDIDVEIFRSRMMAANQQLEMEGCNPLKQLRPINGIRYGHMKLKTVRNDWFGVEGNMSFDLYWLVADVTMEMGVLNVGGLVTNWDMYADMVQCIVATMTSEKNAPSVRTELLQPIFGLTPPELTPPAPRFPGYCIGREGIDRLAPRYCGQADGHPDMCIAIYDVLGIPMCKYISDSPLEPVPGTCEGNTIFDISCSGYDIMNQCQDAKNFYGAYKCRWIPTALAPLLHKPLWLQALPVAVAVLLALAVALGISLFISCRKLNSVASYQGLPSASK